MEEYWAVVESYRTARGPRQRIVAYLGDMEEAARQGVVQAARGARTHQPRLLDEVAPEWVEVDAKRLRVERVRDFGGPWLGLQVLEQLELVEFLDSVIPCGREEIPWAMMSLVLVLSRLCDPSSELRIAEHLYDRTALGDLLGVPGDKVNDDRLYRALDALLPHKSELERHLKQRLGESSSWSMTCCCTTSPAPISRANAPGIRRRRGAIRAIAAPTASRSASPWW